MLSCRLEGGYLEASKDLSRDAKYQCPACHAPVILKAGRMKVPHFAHKTDDGCHHGIGETMWHRRGKVLVAELNRVKGCKAEYEVELGNRRTDVLITRVDGYVWAVELQLKPETNIYKRTKDLLQYVDGVIWVLPWVGELIEIDVMRYSRRYDMNALLSHKHPVPSANLMFYDQDGNRLLECDMHLHKRRVKSSHWFEAGGVERSAGGYDKTSLRWCELEVLREYMMPESELPEFLR